MKRTNILWIAGLALGWFFDFLFWGTAPGINFAIYVALCLTGAFLVLALNGFKPSWKSLILLIPIIFFAVMTFMRLEPLTMFLSLAGTLGLMALLAVTFMGGRWLLYSLSDYVVNFVRLLGSMIARPLTFREERKRESTAAGLVPDQQVATRQGWKRFWSIFRGILIAIPIIAIFAGLLSSADLVFAQRVDDFTRLFRLEKLPEYIFRVIYILIGAYALIGIILHAALKSRDEKLIGVEKPLVAPFLGFTEAAIVLGAVVLLFAAFVLVQFQYFFGGETFLGVQGYTYSEYARRGFGELVAVAFFSLLLFLLLSAIVKRANSTQRWTFSALGISMVLLVGVMLVSAFQRLLLYEAAYGFSRLRMYTHIFMIWLGVLLAVVVVLEILRHERLFALSALLATIGFAATLALVNVDAAIVQRNLARSTQGEPLDVGYLASLSTDSIPLMAAKFQDPSLPAATREAIGAALVCQGRFTESENTDWRSFTLSRWQADQALTKINGELDNYSLNEDEAPWTVSSPSGEEYNCFEMSMSRD